MNPLKRLEELGQSVWLDYIRRDIYTSAQLSQFIAEDGLKGMTTNPTIFQKAIGETDLYDGAIRDCAHVGTDPAKIFEYIAIQDVRAAADQFWPVWNSTGHTDGFVSIEVKPDAAHGTNESIVEARRLWNECSRPNIMIKIPGTTEGIPAINQCLIDGMNINITLLFSLSRYREVVEAYISALETRVAAGLPLQHLRSVASFFVSRIDTKLDKMLDQIAADPAKPDDHRRLARDLRSKFAIANASLAYNIYESEFFSERFLKLKEKGAHVQRLLWASTSVKDPAYPDTYYAEALIAPTTVDTMPLELFDAYKDHGEPRVRIFDHLEAKSIQTSLVYLGIDESRLTSELETEGVQKFTHSYEELMKTIDEKAHAVTAS